ncbi:Chromatin target of PRMT1 protein [Babesia duncani]|uniref:Chromatin target of PRMT1 protein n=1 Tax=Babesia duncani TaxID=323732 RepID=A0AAD9PP05_9APIC|nr:Chromatin target of PRMT1 protein [Babesia duncani]
MSLRRGIFSVEMNSQNRYQNRNFVIGRRFRRYPGFNRRRFALRRHYDQRGFRVANGVKPYQRPIRQVAQVRPVFVPRNRNRVQQTFQRRNHVIRKQPPIIKTQQKATRKHFVKTKKPPTKTKEQLDMDIDKYMGNDAIKARLDAELDDYFN